MLRMRSVMGTSRALGPARRRRLAILVAAGLAVLLAPAVAATATPSRPAAASAAGHVAMPRHETVAGLPDLGANVYVFSPDMDQSYIQSTVDAIASLQVSNQFGPQRFALLFEPGTYGTVADPLIFQVGYYTQVAGLGQSPGDVVVNGSIDVYDQCFTSGASTDCNALDNFWRSLSNLTINVAGGTGCQTTTEFWAVSQAAPMRRVHVNGGFSLMDYCSAPSNDASGGFIADSAFTGATVVNGSQQQFIVRNSNLDGWSNGVWNQVFSGDNGAPAQSFSTTSGLAGGTNPYTTLATSPATQEEPYLYTDTTGTSQVFVPSEQLNSVGPTWTAAPTPGTSLPLSKFFIALPGTSVSTMNRALARGQNLLLTPGVYNLAGPIVVSHKDAIVLGLGYATLVPQHATAAMTVTASSGVKVSGLIFDAGPQNSPVLLRTSGGATRAGHPTLIQDVFFRIGGASAGKAKTSLIVGSSNTILDDVWAWRADHGAGVGWTTNTADTGVLVTGNDVTAYGLFVEHYQKQEVIWNGQRGTTIFFQNEMPYDPPSQAAWMSGPTTDGYPAFTVGSSVKTFQGYGMGSYCFFNQSIDIHSANAFLVPSAAGVGLHDILTRFLTGSGSIDAVVNGTGAAVTSANPGPSDVVDFP